MSRNELLSSPRKKDQQGILSILKVFLIKNLSMCFSLELYYPHAFCKKYLAKGREGEMQNSRGAAIE